MSEENPTTEVSASNANSGISKSLTIPKKRLAGSACCLNCGTELRGPFCYYCGQPDKNFMRFFPALVRELLEDFLDLDSRFTRTLKPLLFQPGKLTRDYLDGLRFRYTPPLRLYIFSSMGFFILAAMLAGSAISFGSSDEDLDDAIVAIQEGMEDEAELEKARDALEKIQPGLADKVSDAVEEANQKKAAENESAESPDKPEKVVYSKGLTIDDDEININGEPWDRETNPFIVPFMPDFVNDWINDEIEQSPQKGKEIEANPNLIIDKVFDVLPATMFVLLPLSALILKFWYLFANRYYVEHLILALHNHSFLFVVFLLSMLLGSLAGWLEPGGKGTVTTVTSWISNGLMIWIPLYFLFSLKRVYQQGWGLTFAKYALIGISYFVLLMTATTVAALLSFVLV